MSGWLIVMAVIVMAAPPSLVKSQQNCTKYARRIDWFFVIDASGSVGRGNFQLILTSLKKFIGEFYIDQVVGCMFGALVYSSTVGSVKQLGLYRDLRSLHHAIDSLEYINEASATWKGIDKMSEQFRKFGRRDCLKVGVLVTDGKSNYPALTVLAADRAKREGVIMVVLAVGPRRILDKVDEFYDVVSNEDFVFAVGSHRTLLSKISVISREVCEKIVVLQLDSTKQYKHRTDTFSTISSGGIDRKRTIKNTDWTSTSSRISNPKNTTSLLRESDVESTTSNSNSKTTNFYDKAVPADGNNEITTATPSPNSRIHSEKTSAPDNGSGEATFSSKRYGKRTKGASGASNTKNYYSTFSNVAAMETVSPSNNNSNSTLYSKFDDTIGTSSYNNHTTTVSPRVDDGTGINTQKNNKNISTESPRVGMGTGSTQSDKITTGSPRVDGVMGTGSTRYNKITTGSPRVDGGMGTGSTRYNKITTGSPRVDGGMGTGSTRYNKITTGSPRVDGGMGTGSTRYNKITTGSSKVDGGMGTGSNRYNKITTGSLRVDGGMGTGSTRYNKITTGSSRVGGGMGTGSTRYNKITTGSSKVDGGMGTGSTRYNKITTGSLRVDGGMGTGSNRYNNITGSSRVDGGMGTGSTRYNKITTGSPRVDGGMGTGSNRYNKITTGSPRVGGGMGTGSTRYNKITTGSPRVDGGMGTGSNRYNKIAGSSRVGGGMGTESTRYNKITTGSPRVDGGMGTGSNRYNKITTGSPRVGGGMGTGSTRYNKITTGSPRVDGGMGTGSNRYNKITTGSPRVGGGMGTGSTRYNKITTGSPRVDGGMGTGSTRYNKITTGSPRVDGGMGTGSNRYNKITGSSRVGGGMGTGSTRYNKITTGSPRVDGGMGTGSTRYNKITTGSPRVDGGMGTGSNRYNKITGSSRVGGGMGTGSTRYNKITTGSSRVGGGMGTGSTRYNKITTGSSKVDGGMGTGSNRYNKITTGSLRVDGGMGTGSTRYNKITTGSLRVDGGMGTGSTRYNNITGSSRVDGGMGTGSTRYNKITTGSPKVDGGMGTGSTRYNKITTGSPRVDGGMGTGSTRYNKITISPRGDGGMGTSLTQTNKMTTVSPRIGGGVGTRSTTNNKISRASQRVDDGMSTSAAENNNVSTLSAGNSKDKVSPKNYNITSVSQKLSTTTSTTSTHVSFGDKRCDNCIWKHGSGFAAHPSTCTDYIVCWRSGNDGRLQASVMSCTVGLFWDQMNLACQFPSGVNCPSDPCKNVPYPSRIPYPNNCRMYWLCKGARTTSLQCCESGMANSQSGCKTDTSCQDACLLTDGPNFNSSCTSLALPENERHFLQVYPTGTRVVRPCPDGMGFVQSTCACSKHLNKPTCNSELLVTFTDPISDSSGYDVPLDVHNVEAERKNGTKNSYAGKFDGNSRILVWRFSQAFWGRNLWIRVRFLPSKKSTVKPQVLVTNGGCQDRPTIVIGYSKRHRVIIGVIDTGKPTVLKTSTGQTDPDGWIEVTYSYTGGLFRLSCDSCSTNISSTASVRGVIRSTRYSLQIGHYNCRPPDFINYVGYIDEVMVSFCDPWISKDKTRK